MGEKPSPLGEDFSRLAVLCNTTARLRTVSMTSSIHVVWITKYRKPVLCGEVAIRVRDLIREICKSMDVEIIKGHVSKDHLHILVSVPPHLSVSKLVQRLKGKTSRKLMSEYRSLAKAILGSSSLGSRLLRRKQRQRDGRRHRPIHRDAGQDGASPRR